MRNEQNALVPVVGLALPTHYSLLITPGPVGTAPSSVFVDSRGQLYRPGRNNRRV